MLDKAVTIKIKTIAIAIASQFYLKMIQCQYHQPITKNSNCDRDRHTHIKRNTLFK